MDRKRIEIKLREAIEDDCYDLWTWRNHIEVRKWCFDKKIVPFQEHEKWFIKKIQDKNIKMYIAENKNKEKLGQVRFEMDNNKSCIININLNPKFFSKGFGNKIIKTATEVFVKEKSKVKEVMAEIIHGNIASKKAFQKAGYIFSHNTLRGDKQIAIFKFKRINDRL
jgi:RimJ/RimL family protein N-acetyltransferase